MKKAILVILAAVLAIGLPASCSKNNDSRDPVEDGDITRLEQQIAAINQSISDLGTIRSNIQTLIEAKTTQGNEITALQQADITLEGKITDLKNFVDTQLVKYATEDWVNATFATLEQLNATKADLDTVKMDVAALGVKCDTLSASLDSAISDINASISALEARIDALEAKVDSLKAMIQKVTIVPAYSDGSVVVMEDTLTVNCIITPKTAVANLAKGNFTVLTTGVLTKSPLYGTLPVAKDEDLVIDKNNGTATIKVNVSSALPAEDDTVLFVALNVKNGISDYTTEFFPVYVAPVVGIGGVKWAKKNIGAEKETDYGYYFFWGGTVGYVYDSVNSKWVKESDGAELPGGFTWSNAPFNNGSAEYDETYFKSVMDTECPEGILATKNDGAAVYCGAGWRMPTVDDFTALANACKEGGYTSGSFEPNTSVNPSGAGASVSKGIYWCTSYDGVAGLLFCDGTNRLFFPAAGYGDITSLLDAGIGGHYWPSSLGTTYMDDAYSLGFAGGSVYPRGDYYRCRGLSVRPVLDIN